MPKIKYDNCGAVGIIKDSFPHDLPDGAWSDGRNIRFRENNAEKFTGESDIHGVPSVDPYAILPYNGVLGRYTVYMGLTKAYAATNSTHSNITRGTDYTGTAANRWTGGVMSGILFVSNNTDVPQFWAGNVATPMANLTNWPANTYAKAFRIFKNYGIALNVTKVATNYPSMVKWSHPADPGALFSSWDITDTTKDCGETDLSETEDAIVDGLSLGDSFIVYKEKSTYSMTFIGSPLIFRFACISRDSGMLTQNCAVNIPGGHCVLTQGDIVFNDGISIKSVISGRMRTWLSNNLDADTRVNSFVVAAYKKNEVWICIPVTGSTWCNLALIWNYKDNAWSFRDLPNVSSGASGVLAYTDGNSWDNDTETWNQDSTLWNQNEYSQAEPRLILASVSNTKIYLTDASRTFSGVTMTASIERTGMGFDAPDAIKLCREVRPRIDATAGTVINIYVGYQAELDAEITWSSAMPWTAGTDIKVDCFVSGRYLSFKFESNTVCAWRMKSFDADIERMGDY